MYLVDQQITVTWVLKPTDTPLAQSAYDINIVPSSLAGTYTDAALTSYVAPTAEFAGSITYVFTPTTTGLFVVHLTTGSASSYSVISTKHFWIRPSVTVFSRCTEVERSPLQSGTDPTYSNTATFLSYDRINAVCQHPGNPSLLYVCGKKLSTDTQGTVAIININNSEVISETLTYPNLNMGGIAVDRNGRVVIVAETETTGFESRYSDNLISWTSMTEHASFNSAIGNSVTNLVFDPGLNIFLWSLDSIFAISDDGQTWYKQQADIFGTNGTAGEIGGCRRIHRFRPNNNNILYFSASSGGAPAGQESVYTFQGTTLDPPPNLIDWTDINPSFDMFGPTLTAQITYDLCEQPDRSRVWACSLQHVVATNTSNPLAWDHTTLKDLKTFGMDSSAGIYHLLSLRDMGKMIACSHIFVGDTWEFFESVDGVSWALSTDTRITNYRMVYDLSTTQYICHYFDGSGAAWVDDTTAGAERIVACVL